MVKKKRRFLKADTQQKPLDTVLKSSKSSCVLELKDVTKSFGGLVAVDSASLAFSKGKITGLIGPNGAGKTTLFNLITGFLKPDVGTIHFNGYTINGLPPWQIAQFGIGRLFQDVRVFDKLTALENVLLARKEQPGENPLVSLFRRKSALNVEKKNMDEARKWIKFVELEEKEASLGENLSYGQQKLLAIARLLAGGFEALLLDEPTAGINPQMVKSVLNVIRRLAQAGKTVVVIEHNMNVIMEISDWVYFMDEGKVVTFGLPREILGDPEVRKAYLGI
ncbi:MAG: ABC transporter ATP-binding protein [Deltaproteobacteria bacterium]|nr:ABC transporter ATP-binding protein [Deltaproteobacteria bacterium]